MDIFTNTIAILTRMKEQQPANSRFAKTGVSSFYDSEVLNPSFVHLMKFRVENPPLRQARNVLRQLKQASCLKQSEK